jgi:protein-tyrosine phosphatase
VRRAHTSRSRENANVIDIHHHCIPGVDDGPRTLEEAADLCRMAFDDGITTIVATPHVLRGPWQNASRDDLERRIAALREAVGEQPRLLLGSEYFFDYDMNEVLQRRDTIVPLAGSRYVLVEFAAHTVPPLVDQPIYRALMDGWIPVIAHPERNAVFQSKPELLRLLVSRGAKTQITAGSILGDFGPEARRASSRWIREDLVHFIASDAHNTAKRPPRMRAARDLVREIAGEPIADALTQWNPAAVAEDRPLEWDPEPADVPKQGVWRRLWNSAAGRR